MAKGSQKSRIDRQIVKIGEQEFRLAKPHKGVDLPIKEKIEIAKVICQFYETDDHTLEECCQAVGVNSRTFFKWRADLPEISEIYLQADKEKETIYRHKLRQRARTNAERLMDGYTVELTEHEAERFVDQAGNVTMVTTRVKRKEVFIRPSVKLTETVLYNMDGRNFEKNPGGIEGVTEGTNIPPIDWVE